MSEFDSGDDLFDGLDMDQILASQPPASTGNLKRTCDRETEANDRDNRLKKQRNNGRDIINQNLFPDDGVLKELQPENLAQMEVAQKLLTETFGYSSFRHEQAGAIGRILAGANVLTVFPTGAGKSLCYQIPATAFPQLDLQDASRKPGEHGITIVVSPLIALMKDQVDALKRKKVPAECIDSTKTWEQQQEIYAALREGKLRILYCAPERLNNEGFVATMRHVRGGVRLLAVDEAHCISEWGHSFRPEYLKVARFADEIAAERVICLTATATPKVVDDICNAFKIPAEGVFRTSAYRPNLNLHARAVKTKHDKYPLLFQFLNENPGPTLVYVTLQQQSVLLAADLREHGFDAEAFHAGMKVDAKTEVQDKFLANRIRIVVATIAFGMGIDKPDIRNIVHFDLSSTIEEYCQQVGRAGRDGNTANCMFYICPDDRYIRENFARGDLPSRKSLKGLLVDIFGENAAKPVGDTFKTSHYVQSRDYDIRQSPLAIIYAALELRFGLIRAITPEYSEYKFTATPSYFARMKTDRSPVGKAIYANATKKSILHHVDLTAIISRTGLPRTDLVRALNELHDTGLIELKAGGIEQKYRILQPLPRPDTPALAALVDDLHADLARREADALRRTQQVEDLVTGDRCLALALAQHFGMGLPDGKSQCGHCSHCLTGRRVVMPPKQVREPDLAGIRRILAACDVRDDPRFLARIAFGIKSPRVIRLKMHNHPVFMTLADHDFETLIREFEKACDGVAE
ncbi:P-loop containing nucleoside triphosphate hydrolase protein [Chaetomium tenue]|uniref:P-loop containing nucleoside triphosphate hydrolase protein n=1 Tax=Chaetomium tenue TaxID=1854479 RepID=A0ACB7P2K4_9PEZI|nr:P-loop containing nucleoside triphosphate hydrolase protein [Chaetomium globosum]